MANAARSKLEYMLAAYVFNTLGVACLAFAVGFGSTAEIDVGPWQRTISGLIVALLMGVGGEFLARRAKEGTWWANSWFSTNLLAFSYTLAYFFIYAMYYVPILQGLQTPYAAWALGLALGGVGALHGATNKHVRWFTSPFTMLATAHALYQALSSSALVHMAGHDVKVAALGCFVGMVWCGGLSVVFKRFELKYPKWADCKTFDEAAGWVTYRLSHEVFFVAAGSVQWLCLSSSARCAMRRSGGRGKRLCFWRSAGATATSSSTVPSRPCGLPPSGSSPIRPSGSSCRWLPFFRWSVSAPRWLWPIASSRCCRRSIAFPPAFRTCIRWSATPSTCMARWVALCSFPSSSSATGTPCPT